MVRRGRPERPAVRPADRPPVPARRRTEAADASSDRATDDAGIAGVVEELEEGDHRPTIGGGPYRARSWRDPAGDPDYGIRHGFLEGASRPIG